MIKCPHCGRKIPYDANLCPYCGRSIKQFQQKDLLDEEVTEEVEDVKETETATPPTPAFKNDKKFLFFIIAVLLLLLVSGLIYHFSSTKEDATDDAETEMTDSLSAAGNTVQGDDAQTDAAQGAASKPSYQPGKGMKVVVNGDGVRLRFGPSLQANYLKNEGGGTKSVKKGTRLPCVGETGDWYQVEYMGKRYYMSKKYTYLEK